jgi:hypothetical protein
MLLRKSTQGPLEEQMFHNWRTLQKITELKEDNVIPFFILTFYVLFNEFIVLLFHF